MILSVYSGFLQEQTLNLRFSLFMVNYCVEQDIP